MADTEAVQRKLAACGQAHLLAFMDELDTAQREALLAEIHAVDWDQLAELIESHVLNTPPLRDLTDLAPPEILPATPADEAMQARYDEARRLGETILGEGKVAAFVVAGGQGTRLGYNGPKGCFRATPVKNKSLFETFAEQILATSRRYGRRIAWYIMTSTSNDAATRAFFADHDYFGLSCEDVVFLTQGMMPAIGLDGKVLLAEKGHLALSPNGHGGSLSALADSGSLADMAARGVEYISYFQVDNPLVKVLDPLFIGLHAAAGSDMSSKALPKRCPTEKLGNFCTLGGVSTIIEYSDLPDELARQTEPDGRLRFGAGSIAIHMISRAAVEQLTAGGHCKLPFHRALKKAPYIAADGTKVTPDAPNAVKLEMFVFDALELVDKTLILETSRNEEFSAVKNASGPDSLATSLADQVRRAADWLEEAGVLVPRDADGLVAAAVEISPLFALDPAELAAKVRDLEIQPGQKIYFGE